MAKKQMQSKIINQKGKETESKLTLDKVVWDLPENLDLVTQVLYIYNSNKRRGTAKAKTRAEVSGGGRKPWRQKGTGRARAGSTRSPIWVKGGVTFASSDNNWKKKINEKMKKKAIATVLSSKLKKDGVKFVKFTSKAEIKNIRQDLTKLAEDIKTLVVSEKEDILKSVRNVKNFKVVNPKTLNIFNSLDNKLILIDSEAVEVIEKRLKNEK
jgi:large subunit ribosomal protein L4